MPPSMSAIPTKAPRTIPAKAPLERPLFEELDAGANDVDGDAGANDVDGDALLDVCAAGVPDSEISVAA
jgi:hypothetical protein